MKLCQTPKLLLLVVLFVGAPLVGTAAISENETTNSQDTQVVSEVENKPVETEESILSAPKDADEVLTEAEAKLLKYQEEKKLKNIFVNGVKFKKWIGKVKKLPAWAYAKAGDSYSKQKEGAGRKIQNVLFNQINNVQLVDESNATASTQVRVSRDVFDNRTLEPSWSVVDFFEVQSAFPIYSTNFSPLGIDNLLSISLGINGRLRVKNIRTMTPENLELFPKGFGKKAETALLEEVESSSWYSDFMKQSLLNEKSNAGPMQDMIFRDEETLAKLRNGVDAETSAKFSKIWNMAILPVRLPLTGKSVLKNMQVGEIITYGLGGAIQAGPSVGYQFGAIEHIGSLSISAYKHLVLSGNFDIAVLRETKTHARLKVTRQHSKGDSKGIHLSNGSAVLYEGINVGPQFAGLDLTESFFNVDLKVTPISVNWSDSEGRSKEIGYVYDLTQEEGRKAYQLAAVGLLSESDRIAAADFGKENPAVARDFTYTADVSSSSSSIGMDLEMFFHIWSNRSTTSCTVSDGNADFGDDGTFQIIRTTCDNQTQKKSLLGKEEREFFNFSAILEKEGTDKGQEFSLYIDGRIDDQRTWAGEMKSYARSLEKMLGIGKVFPRIPASKPRTGYSKNEQNDISSVDLINYGRSAYHFRMALGPEEFQVIKNLSKKKILKVVSEVFGVEIKSKGLKFKKKMDTVFGTLFFVLVPPVILIPGSVKEIYKSSGLLDFAGDWISLTKAKTNLDTAVVLSKMFNSKFYSKEFIQSIILALKKYGPNKKVNFEMSAYNEAYGDIRFGAGDIYQHHEMETAIKNRIDFEVVRNKWGRNTKYNVDALNVEVLDAGKIKISFELKENPNFVYFGLQKSNGAKAWNLKKSIFEAWVVNRGQFKKGYNAFVLDQNDPNLSNFAEKIMSDYRLGKYFHLTVAAAKDNMNQGNVSRVTYWSTPKNYVPPKKVEVKKVD